MTKPASVCVGQQWSNPLCNNRYNPHTVVEAKDHGDDVKVPGFVLRTGNGEKRHWPSTGILQWDYLGGPSQDDGVVARAVDTILNHAATPQPLSTPVPAKGQPAAKGSRWQLDACGCVVVAAGHMRQQWPGWDECEHLSCAKSSRMRHEGFKPGIGNTYVDISTSTRATGAEATVWEHSNNGIYWVECQKTSDVCGHQYTRRKGEAGASGGGDGIPPQMCASCGERPRLDPHTEKCSECNPKPVITREISHNGVQWLPFAGYLTDGDPFESYKFHRTLESGRVAVASPYMQMRARDAMARARTDERDAERDGVPRRAADAAVLATFVDDWDLLADAPGVVRG